MMKSSIVAALSLAFAAFAPGTVSAADYDDDDDDYAGETIIYDEPVAVVRERVIVRRYVAPRHYRPVDDDDDDDDVVLYAPRRHIEHRAWHEPRVRVRHYWRD